MANDYKKTPLSGSTNGMPIKVVATATLGTPIHTADADNTGNVYDEVWLWAYNSSGSAVLLTLEVGDATSPDHNVKVTVPSQSGLLLVLPGFVLNNAKVVTAFAGSANVVTLGGYVNKVTHS